MRREPTEAELRLWRYLRNSRLDGHKFRRQATIGSRIVDFFCPSKGLVVEIDGDTHDMESDALKDERLHQQSGFATMRFSNRDVIENIEGVLETLRMTLKKTPDRWDQRTSTPNLHQSHVPLVNSEEEGLHE